MRKDGKFDWKDYLLITVGGVFLAAIVLVIFFWVMMEMGYQ